MENPYQKSRALLQLPGEVVALITAIGVIVGLLAGATLWGYAVVSKFDVGPQIVFYSACGALVAVLVITLAVVLYRWRNRRKKTADDRLAAIAQEEVRNVLRALLKEAEAKMPELGEELEKAVGEIWEKTKVASEPFLEVLEAYVTAVLDHTHNDDGEAEFPRLKEVTDLLESMNNENDSQSDED